MTIPLLGRRALRDFTIGEIGVKGSDGGFWRTPIRD